MAKYLFLGMLLCGLCGLTSGCARIKLQKCSIYLPPDAPPSVKIAADELQLHVKLATGLTLPITNAPVHPMIALGNSAAAASAGIHTETLPYETIRIVTKNGNLYLLGRDLPNDGITIHGGQSLGTLYAVYEFLERELGVRWLLPGEQGAYIPTLGQDFKLGDLDITYTPPFSCRRFSDLNSRFFSKRYAESWYLRGHTYTPPKSKAGSRWIWENHSWDGLYADPGKPWAKYLKDREKTFAENPDLFELSSNGKRVRPVADFSLCLSNPKIAADVAERVVSFAHNRNDYQQSISPNDGTPRCACDNCKKSQIVLTPEATGYLAYERKNYISWTPLVLDYYRKVAELVKATDPKIELCGLIYSSYEFVPPQKPAVLPDNFCAAMAPLHTGYGPVRLYEPVNQAWCQWFDSWKGVFRHQLYYGVDFWMRQSAGAPLPPFTNLIKQTFDRMREAGYVGGFFYGNQGLGQSGPYAWIMMQMLWNPSANPEELFDEFCSKAYGGGGADIKKLYQLAEENIQKFFARRKGRFGYNMSPEMLEEVYAKDWDKYQALYLSAEGKTATPAERWRLAMLGENLKLLYYHLTRQGYVKEDRNSPLYMSDAAFQKFNERRRTEGDLEGFVVPVPETNYHVLIPLQAKITSIANTETNKLENTWFQYHMDIIIMSPTDQDAVLQLSYSSSSNNVTGKAYLPEVGYFSVYAFDESGKDTYGNVINNPRRKSYYSGIADRGKIVFPVQKNKLYCLTYCGLMDYAANSTWRLDSVNVPYAVGQRIRPQGLLMAATGAPLYFYVPDNAAKFQLYFNGGSKAEIRDSAGTLAATVPGGDYNEATIDRVKDKLQPGWWKVNYQGTATGYIRQSDELSGYFVIDPARALRVERVK